MRKKVNKLLTILLVLTGIALFIISFSDYSGTELNRVLILWALSLVFFTVALNRKKEGH